MIDTAQNIFIFILIITCWYQGIELNTLSVHIKETNHYFADKVKTIVLQIEEIDKEHNDNRGT